MWVNPSARSSSSAAYSGAIQMLPSFTSRTVVVSSGPSAANAGGMRTRRAAPANDRVVRSRRRVCVIGIGGPPFVRSRLQLALELVEATPIGFFGDDLLRIRIDQARFIQPQRAKPHRVVGIYARRLS